MKKLNLLLSVGIIAVLASCSSKPYDVKRETTINVPASEVYAQLINHKNRINWSPWDKMDPNMSRSFEGSESGVGAIYKWSGNDSVGTGSLEIVEVKENEYVKTQLKFTAPWESESIVEWWLEENNGVTKAVWGNKGEIPAMGAMFMDQTMDEMLGPDFEKGLADLKSYCEANYQPEPVADDSDEDGDSDEDEDEDDEDEDDDSDDDMEEEA